MELEMLVMFLVVVGGGVAFTVLVLRWALGITEVQRLLGKIVAHQEATGELLARQQAQLEYANRMQWESTCRLLAGWETMPPPPPHMPGAVPPKSL